MSASARSRVAVVGAGIAGLTTAFYLQRAGMEVDVFEADDRAGGAILTTRRDGYVVEGGPNTLQRTSPELEALLEALGLDEAVVEADAAASKRYVVRDGRPLPLPSSPPALVTTPLFSPRAKLRLLGEPFVAAAPPDADESVAAFARRRLGPEVLDYAVDPFVGGIFAGDPARLSLRHAFPTLHELEQEYGSLLVGGVRSMIRRRRERGDAPPPPRRRTFTLRDGLQMLPDTLARALGDRLHLDASVTAMARSGDGWALRIDGHPAPDPFDAVAFAAPVHRLREIDFEADEDLAPLDEVAYPPVTVVALGLPHAQVAHPLDGFGVLVPSVERGFRILGALFISSLFPDRAPEGHVLLSAFLGGARRPELAGRPEGERTEMVVRDLRRLLGVRGAPTFVHQTAWPHAIPQYTMGYGATTALLGRLEAAHPGLAFAGNYRGGISVVDTVASGRAAARRLTDLLR